MVVGSHLGCEEDVLWNEELEKGVGGAWALEVAIWGSSEGEDVVAVEFSGG